MTETRRPSGPSVAEIMARALPMIETIAAELAPGGTREQHRYRALNPTRNDRTAGSFVIDVAGSKRGRWIEFAAGANAREGEGGDLIDLVGYVKFSAVDYKSSRVRGQAIRWLAERVGLAEPGKPPSRKPAVHKRQRDAERDREIERQRRIEEERKQRDDKRRAKRAAAWWLREGRPIAGTAAEIYLTTQREIPTHMIRRPPGAVRFLAANDEGRGCAMFCAMSSPAGDPKFGRIVAVHLTNLTDDGRKIEREGRDRLMWGPYQGAAIRISKGGSSMSPEAAAIAGEKKPLVICEGVEDGYCAALLWPARRVWAAGTVGNIGAIAREHGWPACASEVIILRDNDPETLPDGRRHPASAAIENAAQAFMECSRGRPVSIAAAIGEHDLNDLWRQTGKERAA